MVMKEIIPVLIITALLVSCHNKADKQQRAEIITEKTVSADDVLIASDIITDVIIKPAADGDPWEVEKVAGYKGDPMITAVFNHIYDGSLLVSDYHSGVIMSIEDVKAFEKEFDNDRSKIGKLSFTEDWYYNPVTNSITKVTKSVVLGYEIIGDEGRVSYKAAFKVELGK